MRTAWSLLATLALLALLADASLASGLLQPLKAWPHGGVAEGSNATSLETEAAKLLEDFRVVMKSGRPDFNIRVLDPALVESIVVDAQHILVKAKIVATNSSIAGVSSFTVSKLAQLEGTNKLVVELQVPELDIIGDCRIDGKLQPFTKINGQGPYTLSAKAVTLSATVDVLANDDGSFNLREVTVNTWSFDEIKIELQNLFGGGKIGQLANSVFNKVLPTLVENHRAKVNSWIETVTESVFNKYLNGLAGKESANLVAKVQELSESFRAAMKSGRQDLGIAVLDPAVVSNLAVHVHKWLLDGEVNISNVTVSGGSDFKLTEVTQLVGTNKLALEVQVPALTVASNYNLASKLNVGFAKFHLKRQGTIQEVANNVVASGTAELTLDTDGELSLYALEIESLTYGSLQVEVDALAAGGFFQRNINKLIAKLVPSLLVKPHLQELTAWLGQSSQQVLGRFLDGLAGRVVLPDLDLKAGALLEDLKAVLQKGSSEYGFPVLDPFILDSVPFSFEGKLITASIVAKDIQVSGTSAYNVSSIQQVAGSNAVAVQLDVPEINGSGAFEVEAQLPWPAKKVTDKGSLTLTTKGLKVQATAQLGADYDGSLVLKKLKIETWDFDSVKVTFTKLQDSHIGALLNSAVNLVLPRIIKGQADLINDWAEVTAKAVLDQYLAGVAAKSALPVAVHITSIPAEARSILAELARTALSAGLAQAA